MTRSDGTNLVIATSVEVAIRAGGCAVDAATPMRSRHLRHQLQRVAIPHLQGPAVAGGVQEVLVPDNGRHAVGVGLVPGRSRCQLPLLIHIPGPAGPVWGQKLLLRILLLKRLLAS